MKPNGHGDSLIYERSLLGVMLEDPSLWERVSSSPIVAEDFMLRDHRLIWTTMRDLHTAGDVADIVTVGARLDGKVDFGYIANLVDGVIKVNVCRYAKAVSENGRERRFLKLQECLAKTRGDEERRALLADMQIALESTPGTDEWRHIFHTLEDFKNAPPLSFVIENFLQRDGITLLGGLAGHGKTLVMLAMAQSLLCGTPLFGCEFFKVPNSSSRVVYLVPESSIGPFWTRLKLFKLEDHLRADRLLVRTLSSRQSVTLEDPRILRAVEDADVFLDTAVRFMAGSENEVESIRPFANSLFRLLAAGARTIIGAHHAPKGFESATAVSLEGVLRGSGDLGSMLCCAWALRQVDPENNKIFVSNAKARDFQACRDFVIQGRPFLDEQGTFRVIEPPGQAKTLKAYLDDTREKGGAPVMAGRNTKADAALKMRAEGRSLREIARELGISKSTVDRLLFDADLSHSPSHGTGLKDSSESGP